MSMPPVGWPPGNPFPQSTSESRGVGAGPDFPSSAGGREQGKFRPSRIPLLTQVAVTGDDGQPVGSANIPNEENIALFMRAMVRGLEILIDMTANDGSAIDLLSEVLDDDQVEA